MNPIAKKLFACSLSLTPVLVFAFTAGPPIGRTGAMTDGGLSCTACHRGADANSDARGRLALTVANYLPGVPQKITIRLTHPEAMKWGFQLTARLESDPTKQAGTFTQNDDVQVRCAGATQDLSAAGNLPFTPAPCNGTREFAMHRAASTSPGTGTGRTWEVEWTPPEASAGKIVFYVAGNAANNSGSNAGDLIYTTSATIEQAAATGPKPALTRNGVVEAFNAGTTVSANTWIAIFGTNLAPTTRNWNSAIQGDTLPTALSGVSVIINNKKAPISYVSPTQINALAPADTATGDVRIVVTTPSGDSEPLTITRGTASPGIFALPGPDNKLYAVVVSLTGELLGKRGTHPAITRAARPGEVVQLFGTGFGATSPDVPTDKIPAAPVQLAVRPTIFVNDTAATFAGTGNLVGPGLYQFNLTVPASLADGDVSISASAGGVRTPSNIVLSVAK